MDVINQWPPQPPEDDTANKGGTLGAATPTGLKLDDEKVRLDLLPFDALVGIAHVLTHGAEKYADRNWELGISYGRVFSALMRHMWAWWQRKTPTSVSFLFGELDEETGMSHLWHAGCCMLFLISYEARSMKQCDDRPQTERVNQ